jgi:hypothetical protein
MERCPQCQEPMVESAVKVSPGVKPEVIEQPAEELRSSIVVGRLECPKCHHMEGRLLKGRG